MPRETVGLRELWGANIDWRHLRHLPFVKEASVDVNRLDLRGGGVRGGSE